MGDVVRKALAVAVLDFRRLWMIAGATGVALGIIPALARGVGVQLQPMNTFPWTFAIAAAVAGITFGSDFAEGKPSFFFARPLSTPALFAGRVAAMGGLCAAAWLGFIASYWLSGRQSLIESLLPITTQHVQIAAAVWVGALFFALFAATHTRQVLKGGFVALVMGGVRMAASVVATALMFGLFLDLATRAHVSSMPMKLLGGSYAVAAFLSSWVAVEMGRTDRLRIIRVLSVGTYLHAALACGVVLGAWIYILHPGPAAIICLTYAFSAPDGRVAYVSTRVNRGDPATFRPVFSVDLVSGEAQRSTAEWFSMRHSRDGGTKVWNEETPLAFRYVRGLFTRSSGFRYRTAFGDAKPFELPGGVVDFDRRSLQFPSIDILPASSGDLFAVRWYERGLNIAFMSPSRGQLSAINLPSTPGVFHTWAFLASGQLRAATYKASVGLQFVDIDPATGSLKTVGAATYRVFPNTLFDASASRALMVSGEAGGTVSLLQLEGSAQAPPRTLATGTATFDASFLGDGRVAVIVRQPPTAELRLFSPDGTPEFSLPLGDGFSRLGGEMFVNVVAVTTLLSGRSEVLLIDTTSGKILRRAAGFHAISSQAAPPPPGSPGARLLMSVDNKLFLLPSVTEEPRLLLIRP